MKNKTLVAIIGLVIVYSTTIAQPKELAKFFPAAAVSSGGAANVQTLVGGYITPIAEDFGALSNGGWYNTAATHKKFGFDLSVTVTTIFAKSESKYFTVNSLSGVGLVGGQVPTAYGPEVPPPTFNYNPGEPNITTVGFTGPGGGNVSKDIPIGSLIVPTIQGGLGLFGNTDLRFRFSPGVTISGTELKNWGVGLLHDIKQHIPGIKIAPISLSLLLAYGQLTATTDLSGLYSSNNTKQEGVGDTKSYTVQVLFSKSVPVVTFYVGLGYNSATTTYSVNGTYVVNNSYIGGSATPLPSPVTLTNPFNRDFSTSGFRGTGGIRFKFGPITLHGDYTLFNGKGLFSTGFGFTVR